MICELCGKEIGMELATEITVNTTDRPASEMDFRERSKYLKKIHVHPDCWHEFWNEYAGAEDKKKSEMEERLKNYVKKLKQGGKGK